MSTNCTWQGCLSEGARPQMARDGTRWAMLCSHHDHELAQAVRSGEPATVCNAWAKAHGHARFADVCRQAVLDSLSRGLA